MTCPATTRDGLPCRGTPLPTGWCFAHDPALADIRAAGNRRGGVNKATTARLTARMPPTIGGVVDVLVDTLDRVRDGRMEPARGRAVAALARAIVAAHAEHVTAIRLDGIERHLDDLAAAGTASRVWSP
jgi:hypothetical protein